MGLSELAPNSDDRASSRQGQRHAGVLDARDSSESFVARDSYPFAWTPQAGVRARTLGLFLENASLGARSGVFSPLGSSLKDPALWWFPNGEVA